MGIGSAAPITSYLTISHTKWSEFCSSGENLAVSVGQEGGWPAIKPS